MKNIRPYIYIILLNLIVHSIVGINNSINYKFNYIDAEQGLSNSEIKCIYKDRIGFMWFGTPSGLNRYDGYEIRTYKQEFDSSKKQSFNNDINRIQEDFEGKLWIETRLGYTIYNPLQEQFEYNLNDILKKYANVESDQYWNVYIDQRKNFWFNTWEDVRLYDIKTNTLTVFTQGEPESLSRGLIVDIKQGQNRYWFLFENGLLESMDAQSLKVIKRDSTLQKTGLYKNERNLQIFIDSSGDVWTYNDRITHGVSCYHVAQNTWETYSATSPAPYRISTNAVTSIEEDKDGNIWVGTDHGGVNIINKKRGIIRTLLYNEDAPHIISQNTIKCILRDNTGIMWLGTYKKGLCYYHESIYKFKTITNKSKAPFNDINCFEETPEGNIWIGTNGGGLLYYDRNTEKYTVYKHNTNENSPAGDVIVSLTYDPKGRLWIGYYLEGLDCFDGKSFIHYKSDPNNKEGLSDNNAWAIKCDKSGNLWVGTLNGGIVVLDISTGKRLRYYDSIGSVRSLIETRSGNILVGSEGGLFIYNATTDKLEQYQKESFANMQLDRNDINTLYEDSRGLLWIGTRNGLYTYNPYTKKTHLFKKANGLSSDLVQSIFEDSTNDVWVATNRGLTCIKISTNTETPGYFFNLSNYDKSDGLESEQFNLNAGFFTSKSELIFGGSSGFNIFTPSEILYNKNNPRVVLTDLQIYRKSIKPNVNYNGKIILTKSITETEQINLSHKDNYFSLSFAALDYCMPEKIKYYYKLEGFNDQWLEADNKNRKVTYTNLSPGNYTFYLKAYNNDGFESFNSLALQIHVLPPFWLSVWAYLFYILLFIGAILFLLKWNARKSEKKLIDAREKLEITQQREINEMKIRFFTNISHEFRTPLTLILSPLNDLIQRVTDEDNKESLRIMQRNALNLLSLVNQLLDFRKLDIHEHNLRESLGDIVEFVKQQAELFTEVMLKKNIRFTFSVKNIDSLHIRFDADKLSKVIVNILSNAYKFTPPNGKISMELSQKGNNICIIISDSGIGIPEEDREKVFDRFYQVKRTDPSEYEGSGIGLHIAKEFITLHNGEIRVDKSPEGGSRFIIFLPCKETIHSTDEIDSEFEKEKSSLPKILIVEDNKDLREFLVKKLKNKYSILEAENGAKGLDVAFKEIPDIIISDIMMPIMDGLKMSKAIKEDIRTSHIPIIMLTAKTSEESYLEGLTSGADDYITKPFNPEILQLKIQKQIDARKHNQAIFKEQIQIEPSKITINSLDQKLIKKALEYTEANIANPDFSVEELSRELGMSRVHLYKKISSLTGKTPIEFIRVVRLKRAAQLLQESQLSVSEISYEVGFNNPKYFRKYFKDEFGVLPSQYEQKEE